MNAKNSELHSLNMSLNRMHVANNGQPIRLRVAPDLLLVAVVTYSALTTTMGVTSASVMLPALWTGAHVRGGGR